MTQHVTLSCAQDNGQPCFVGSNACCGTDKVAQSPLRCARDGQPCFVGSNARCGTGRCGEHRPPSNRFRRLDKPGSVYTGVGGATVKTSEPLVDGDRVFVYRDEGGLLFARRIAEFVDGRFKAV